MPEVEKNGSSKPRYRSPPYPSINLSKAIERAKQLYDTAMHHPASSSVLGEAWGYGEKSSGLWATMAALLQYGLAIGQGSGKKRKLILTETAMRIIRDADPDSEKRKAAIQRAAKSPTLFSELIEQFGTDSNVSTVMLKNYLVLDRTEAGKASYSNQAADDLISVFKQTMDFAEIRDSAILPSNDKEKGGEDEFDVSDEAGNGEDSHQRKDEESNKSSTKIEKGTIQMGERELTTGLLSKKASFRLIVTGKIGAKEIERLIAKLELDKEILAEPEADESTHS